LGIEGSNGIDNTKADVSVFSKITSDRIELKTPMNVDIYNVMGVRVTTLKAVNSIDLNSLNQGVYIIRAGKSTLKVIR